jgi:short-subunit dehydrogenase
MARVAVAGGTSGLGLLVVKAIVATKKHNVFVLSRKVINRTLATSYHKR